VGKTQRIRDPVHDLIVFSKDDDFAQFVWRLINCREFQRLRRIRQLGFSELVYPGATHTRFAHSLGVFHMARRLVGIIRKLQGEIDERRAEVAICAALLHDIGHGPFSHTFETVLEERGAKRKHEAWTAEIIRGDTEVNRILGERELVEETAELLEAEYPSDIYASIVHSQFDADRIDYLRRDQLMTGTGVGGFDWEWLLDCLEIGNITSGVGEQDDESLAEVDSFILGRKGLQAAEGYLLGRFHLYTQVYLHKTTRSAEKMLGALLGHVADRIGDNKLEEIGLAETHPLVSFIRSEYQDLNSYLELDDIVLSASLLELSHAPDPIIAKLATQ